MVLYRRLVGNLQDISRESKKTPNTKKKNQGGGKAVDDTPFSMSPKKRHLRLGTRPFLSLQRYFFQGSERRSNRGHFSGTFSFTHRRPRRLRSKAPVALGNRCASQSTGHESTGGQGGTQGGVSSGFFKKVPTGRPRETGRVRVNWKGGTGHRRCKKVQSHDPSSSNVRTGSVLNLQGGVVPGKDRQSVPKALEHEEEMPRTRPPEKIRPT